VRPATATTLYAALTVPLTWPVVRGLGHTIVGDYGDPLLNVWILAWDATHMFAKGAGWWNANIFSPHPLALGYSEHLAAQAFQILPIYWATGNPILCYNLIFLSTFVLSGLGAFLLVRDLTGNPRAAFVAGAAYAFAPYRIASLPHIQVLSSAWMPFVLYGFRRYFATHRILPLAGASAAWLCQNLSCGYYLLFFSPIVVIFLMWELTVRKLWSDARVVGAVAIACAVVAAATTPYLLPYLELRRLGFDPRSIGETQKFSADVYGYLTADPNMRLWGRAMRAWPKAEGALFPGFTVVVLASMSVARPFTGRVDCGPKRAALLLPLVIMLILLMGGSIRLPLVKITSLERALVIAGAYWIGVLILFRGVRQSFFAWLRTPGAFFVLMTVFAVVMSFGPIVQAKDRVVLDANLYDLLYRYVPGFDGLRVPARYGMIVALGLAVLAGFAVTPRMAPAAAALILLESFAAPLPVDQNPSEYKRPGLAALPDLQRAPPPVYDFVRALPAGVSIVELPLGEPAFDVRYMYYSTRHWRPLVNGYTGGLPRDYEFLDQMLQDVFTRPARAWTALRQADASHAIVHESYYAEGRGAEVSEWLRSNRAREIARFGPDRVFQLK
jgi:hypothetical protein